MKIKSVQLLTLILLSFLSVQALENGNLWECDPILLQTDQVCLFKRTDGVKYGPHILNKDKDCTTLRKVESVDGTQLHHSSRPIDACDELATTREEEVGNELRYVQMFEMMAPVYDYAMFAPGNLSHWSAANSMLSDCGLMTTTNDSGLHEDNYYSTHDIRVLMINVKNNNIDIHNEILQYLQKAQFELLCIMSDGFGWDTTGKCQKLREDRGLSDGDFDTCWERHFVQMPKSYDGLIQYHSKIETQECENAKTSSHEETHQPVVGLFLQKVDHKSK